MVSAKASVRKKVSGTTIKSSKRNKLLGVLFDDKLKFDTHIENICKKANRKLNVLARGTPENYNEIIINSQFNYFPVSWMFQN